MDRKRLRYVVMSYLAACSVAVLAASVPFMPFLFIALFISPQMALLPLEMCGFVLVFALLPSAVAITYAERHSVQSRMAHVFIGAAVGVVTLASIFAYRAGISGQSIESWLVTLIGAIPGAIGGFVYYCMAGQEAGGLFQRASA